MRRTALVVGLVGLVAASACSQDALSQLVVVVDSDLPSEAFDAITLDVRSATGAHQTATLGISATRPLPASVSLVHRGGPLGPIEITADARLASSVVVSRLVRTSFVSGQTLTVRVQLLGACIGRACGAGETCGEDGCERADVPTSSLDRWSGRLPPPLTPEPLPMDADVVPDAGPPDAQADDVREAGPPDDAADVGAPDAGDAGPDAGPSCVPRHPPPRPTATTDPSGFQRFFAIERFDIGTAAPGSWRDLGFDLDGRCTDAESSPDELECRTNIGIGHPDGNEGIDNQFGAAIIPAISAFDPDLFSDFNTSFARGTYGLVLSVSGWNLTNDDDAVVVGLLEATSGRGPFGPPEHIGEDTWVISTDSLIGGDLERPLCAGNGWVSDGTLVADLPSRCGFRILSSDGNLVDVRLSRPTVVATLDEGDPRFGEGLLVGRWRVNDFVDVFRYISEAYCPDGVGPAIEMALRTSADVLAEGAANPMEPCDALSFGARFRGGLAHVDPMVGPAFTSFDYCM